MSAPHNPQCQTEPSHKAVRDWGSVCCPHHAARDERIDAAAKAIAISAMTRHGSAKGYISHEHAYRCIAEAMIAALDQYDANGRAA